MAQSIEQLQAAAKAADAALAKAQAEADALAKAKATPRTPEAVLSDIIANIAGHLGNRPDLRVLQAEYKAATKQSTS